MDDRRNYYRVLHLQPDAPIELVQVNYRTLMQKLGAHPDLGGEHWSAAHLNAAYQTLRDPVRRAAYDQELLEAYDIQTLAGGGGPVSGKAASAPVAEGTNQRNYYRVLQVQRDAPLPIIEASHAALSKAQPERVPLFDEAMAVLRVPELREAYDRLLAACAHPEAASRLHRTMHDDPGYRPSITAYCAFCMTPHGRVADRDADACCGECDSPLFPPPRGLLDQVRRAVSRIQRDDPVTLHFDWPGPAHRGQVLDLSPTGMRFRTAAPLDNGDVVKVASACFDAVGSVAHREAGAGVVAAGLRFLAVRFPESLGTFVSMKA